VTINWHQIGSQVLSTLLAVGPLGIAAKFYLDRSLKKLDASAAERLETLKDELGKKRDSRQALITQSTLATQKALEIEFKVIQDLQSGIVRLHDLMFDWGPYMEPDLPDDTQWTKLARMIEHAKPLEKAHDDLLRVGREMKPFFPESIYEAVERCLHSSRAEISNIVAVEIVTGDGANMREATRRAQENRNEFEPLAAAANNLMRERLAVLKRIPD
jgi:hypothetical protein